MKRRGLAILLGAAILMGMLASIPHVLTLDVVQAMTSFGDETEESGIVLFEEIEVFGVEEGEEEAEEDEEVPDEEAVQIVILEEDDEEIEIEEYRPERHPVQLSLDPGTYCGLPSHIHGVFCYDENSELICSASEHEHDDACFVDPDATENDENDVENEENESEETEYWSVSENETENQFDNDENETENDTDDGLNDEEEENGDDEGIEDNEETESDSENDEDVSSNEDDDDDAGEDGPDEGDEPEEGKPVCEMEEHLHGDSCFDEDGSLICGIEEHIHDEVCGGEPTGVQPDDSLEDNDGNEEDDGDDGDGAITDGDCICGFGAHVHDGDCYDEDGNLICGLEEHVHDEDCLPGDDDPDEGDDGDEEEEDYICGFGAHVHDGDCYDEDGNLICGLEEHVHDEDCLPGDDDPDEGDDEEEEDYICGFGAHVHDGDCYDEDGNLICGLEEHVHDESCLPGDDDPDEGGDEEEEDYICGFGAHVHDGDCYDEDGNLICGLEEHVHDESCLPGDDDGTMGSDDDDEDDEDEGEPTCDLDEHIHGDDCYDEDGELICEIEEHVHDEECGGESEIEIPEENPCDLIEHTHGEGCYDETGSIICMLEEHVHDEECGGIRKEPEAPKEPEEEENSACRKKEHVHSTACCSAAGAIICGMEEHIHGSACGVESSIPGVAGSQNGQEADVRACGLAAHTHTDYCFDVVGNLICGMQEHAHTEACDAAQPEQPEQDTPAEATCGKQEHLHSATCRDDVGNIICGIEEHMHGDACAQEEEAPQTPADPEQGEYLCEKAAHTHDDSCYDEAGVMICMLEEHVHDETCTAEAEFDTTACEKQEHIHGENCYDEGGILSCTLEEHTHGENCGEAQDTEHAEICEKIEHMHEKSCYDEAGVLVCPLEEHVHSKACSNAPGMETDYAACEKPEHLHGKDCYDEMGALICTLEEHIHGEGCQTAEAPAADTSDYLCGKAEHSHDEDCFDAFGTVICGMEEHTHTGECLGGDPLSVTMNTGNSRFDTTALGEILISAEVTGGAGPYSVSVQMMRGGNLVQTDAMLAASEVVHMYRSSGTEDGGADMEEAEMASYAHEMTFVPESVGVYNAQVTVTDAFGQTTTTHQILPVACDIYETQEMWEATMADVVLTGDPRADIVAIAQSQIGYTESDVNFILDENNKPMFYTRYGDWWGAPYSDWCAMFVSFCMNYAGVTNMPMSAGTMDWTNQMRALSLFEDPETYPPMAGDLVFFDRDGDGFADHVGIVESVTYHEETGEILLHTIEGNVSQGVMRKQYPLPCDEILGYTCMGKNVIAQRAENTEAYIAAIPSIEEIMAQYESLPEEEKDAYIQHMMMVVKTAYAYYEDLGPAYRPYVKNIDRLYTELGSLMPMMIEGVVDHNVYQSNTYTMADTTIVSGGSPREVLGEDMGFAYWDALVVDQDPETGMMMITQYDTTETEKLDIAPASENGYVVLVHDKALEIGEETAVAQTFDYAQPAEYTPEGLGEMLFFTPFAAEPKALSRFRGADTSEFIEVNLYDYNDAVNDRYTPTGNMPGFQNPRGETKGDGILKSDFGDIITVDVGTTGVAKTNASAKINSFYPGYIAARAVEDAMAPTMSDGYPVLITGESLKYLWTNNGATTKMNDKSVNYLFQHNDETGAYYYNSIENHAQFDPSDDTFWLYNQLITSNFIFYPFGNFLPFNDIDAQATQASAIDRNYFMTIGEKASALSASTAYNYSTLATVMKAYVKCVDGDLGTNWVGQDLLEARFDDLGFSTSNEIARLPRLYSIDYDKPTDFFFGMSMEMTLMQPKNGLTGKNNNLPMVFEFTGDDDVWVYIDDVLFLDLSGIHRHVGGEIDFEKGEVRYRQHDKDFGSGNNYKTVKFADIPSINKNLLDANGRFKDYSTHKFNFYYMERGSGSSVCRMNFNFPLLHKNSIVVGKELTTKDDVSALGNPDFKFQVLKENKTDLFIAANTPYKIYNGEDVTGTPIGTGTTDVNGVFTLKAGQTAVFEGINENAGKYVVRELLEGNVYEQYGTITVSGQSTTRVNDVTIGNDVFTGVDSPVTDMSSGTTYFRFDNKFDADKLGGLSVVKKVDSEFSSGLDLDYTFRISLDGKLLPVGTEYTVENEDGTTTTKTVTAEGEIVVKENQKATLMNILAGTKYKVEEMLVNGEVRYDVVWENESGEILSQYTSVDGTIPVGTPTVAVARNKELGTKIEIPGTKALSKYDPDKQRRYTFTLEKVTDATGNTVDTAFAPIEQTVTITDAAQTFKFEFDIGLGQYPEYPQMLYYRIRETGTDSNDTMHNNTVYIAEVKLEKVTTITGEGAEQTTETVANATLTKLWRGSFNVHDNNKVENLVECASISADFVNTLFDSLTIEKQVKGEGAAMEQKFSFTVKLEAGDSGAALPENYTAYIPTADGTQSAIYLTLGEDGMLTREGGDAITLGHGEKIVIAGIPYGAKWTVTEESVLGYHTVTSLVKANGTPIEGSGTTTTDEIVIGGNEVTYTNVAGVELPHTGGQGTTHLYTMGGSLLMLAATLLLYKMRQRKEGADGIC